MIVNPVAPLSEICDRQIAAYKVGTIFTNQN